MDELKIELASDHREFFPGEEVAGTVSWRLGKAPREVHLHLLWYTQGKGDRDAQLIRTVEFQHPASEDSRPFHIYLPRGPYSFSGRLVSIIWGFELIANSSKEAANEEIVLSPTGKEVRPPNADEQEAGHPLVQKIKSWFGGGNARA